MPIFEYKCQDCESTFEKLILSTSMVTEIKCPKCRGTKVTQLFSSFGVSGFGSSGFAESDSHSACHSCSSKKCATCH